MRSSSRVLLVAITVLAASAVGAGAAETLHADHTFTAIPGGTVVVDVSFHSVEVRVEPGSTVRAIVDLEFGASGAKAQRMIEAYTPEFSQDGDRILIRSTSRKGFSGWSRKKGRVEVTMPSDIDLVVDSSSGAVSVNGDLGSGTVECDTSSGSIRVRGAMRELVADASSGSVRAELTRLVDRVHVDTSSGSVTVDGPTPDIRIGTSSGSISAAGLTGNAKLDASSGSITARWTEIPPAAVIDADASSGSVRLHLPAGTMLEGFVDTSSGGIHSDFPGELSKRHNHLRLEGGPDAVRLRVNTSSGGVRLTAE